MSKVVYHPIGSAIWEDESAFMGSTHSIFVLRGDTGVLNKGRETVYGLDVVLVWRTLFDGS